MIRTLIKASGITLCLLSIQTRAQQLPYQNSSLPIDQRVEDLLGRMTIDEKMAQIRHIHSWDIFNEQELDPEKLTRTMDNKSWGFVEAFPLTGENCRRHFKTIQEASLKTRLGIPVFTVAESLHGAVNEGATIFPQNIAMGSTFNPELAREKTRAISDDLHYMGVRQVLAPCIDVVRELRWGRVEESYGEDPMLCGLYGIAEVNGYMEKGISPMLKHYGPHGNPLSGLNLASVECGMRDLHEIYLKPFEMVVKNTPILAIMSSYNSWNHIPNSASHYLMTEVLRDQWGFKGYIYSDWGVITMLKNFHYTAHSDAEAADQALAAGLDVEASSKCYPALVPLVQENKYDVKIIDEAVRRVLYTKFAMGLFEDPFGDKFKKEFHSKESIRLAKQIADESAILLKNDANLLPLDRKKLKSIAIIGPNADQVQFGDYTWSKKNEDGITPLEGIRNLVGKKVQIHYAKGCEIASLDQSGIAEAVEAARKSDVAVVFVGSSSTAFVRYGQTPSTSGEGMDLHDLNLTGAQSELIKAVQATGKPVVLVLVAGKPFTLAWEKENIPAILVQWYAGEQAGNSIADILFGEVAPSGRLNYTFPQSTGHLPVYYNYLPSDRGFYKRPGTYEKPGRDYVFGSPAPLFDFGRGLTYTTFEYNNIATDKDQYDLRDTIYVTVNVKNTGKREAKEVVQLYVRDKVSRYVTPVKELRDFAKVSIAPGKSRTVTLKVPVSELYVVDEQNRRVVEPGVFEMQVGASSAQILQQKNVRVGEITGLASVKSLLPEKAKKSTQQIAVTGVVRDVQATLLDGVSVIEKSSGKELAKSDANGRFKITTGNNEVLVFKKSGYLATEEPVDNQSSINVRIDYGNN